jgi:hypothetical protein
MKMEKPNVYSIKTWLSNAFGVLGTILSILLFFRWETLVPKDVAGYVYALFLMTIVVLLACYAVMINLRKLHRYPDVPRFVHYVNHTVRDTITSIHRKLEHGELTEDDIRELEGTTIELLNAISSCFSLLTGTQCGVCVKEFTSANTIGVKYRDSVSRVTRGQNDGGHKAHPIEDDTPVHDAYYGLLTEGSRSYQCNNIIDEWRQGRFKSPSFEWLGGEPETFTVLGYKFVKSWRLKYRCALVSPIRYVRARPTEGKMAIKDNPNTASWLHWGFLCIDANRRHAFDFRRQADIAALFSDVLFVYFNEIYYEIVRYRQRQSALVSTVVGAY